MLSLFKRGKRGKIVKLTEQKREREKFRMH